MAKNSHDCILYDSGGFPLYDSMFFPIKRIHSLTAVRTGSNLPPETINQILQKQHPPNRRHTRNKRFCYCRLLVPVHMVLSGWGGLRIESWPPFKPELCHRGLEESCHAPNGWQISFLTNSHQHPSSHHPGKRTNVHVSNGRVDASMWDQSDPSGYTATVWIKYINTIQSMPLWVHL